MAPDSRKLLGTYRTPKCKIGERVDCLARGVVIIIGLSAGRIQWPVAVRPGIGGRSLVLNWDLAEAIRRETNRAVCHWWGVTPQTVSKWRKALGVKNTEATTRWRTKFGKSWKMQKAIKAMGAKARDPQRRAKIAAARRGKPRPAGVIERLTESNCGRKHTKAASDRGLRSTHLHRSKRRRERGEIDCRAGPLRARDTLPAIRRRAMARGSRDAGTSGGDAAGAIQAGGTGRD